jgi:hypothetical protein
VLHQNEDDGYYDEEEDCPPDDYFQSMDPSMLQNMISTLSQNPNINQLDPSMQQNLNMIYSKFHELQSYNPDIFVYDPSGKTGEERLILGIDEQGEATELGKFTVISDRIFNENLN